MKRNIVFLLLLAMAPLYASNQAAPLQMQNSSETPLTARSQAEQWGLTHEEWSRFEAHKLSERGIWSPSLDPLTLLGVEATSDAERQRYAELLVEKEYQRIEKELAFQRAYDAAWKRRFPDLMPVSTKETVKKDTRLAVFVRENCLACDMQLKTLLKGGNPLDIWLVGSADDDTRLKRWAQTQGIDPERVKKREITLNHDGGRWLHYGQGRMPTVLEKQGDTWLPIFAP